MGEFLEKRPRSFLRNSEQNYKVHGGSLGKKIVILFVEECEQCFEKSLEEILIKNIKGILEDIPGIIPTDIPGAFPAWYSLVIPENFPE